MCLCLRGLGRIIRPRPICTTETTEMEIKAKVGTHRVRGAGEPCSEDILSRPLGQRNAFQTDNIHFRAGLLRVSKKTFPLIIYRLLVPYGALAPAAKPFGSKQTDESHCSCS